MFQRLIEPHCVHVLLQAFLSSLGRVIGSRVLFLRVVASGTCVLVYHFARDLCSWRIGIPVGNLCINLSCNMWQPVTHEADPPTVRFSHQQSTQFVLHMMKTWPIYLCILAALGLVVSLLRWHELLFIYSMFTLTIAQNIIYYCILRFHAPIEPMLILLHAGNHLVIGAQRKWNIALEN